MTTTPINNGVTGGDSRPVHGLVGSGGQDMIIELADPTGTLLQEIENSKCTRNVVAKTYALALLSTVETDWARVNRAIIARWSHSALEWIKARAWSGKCFEIVDSGLETRKADKKDNMQHLRTPAQATRRSLRRQPFCLPVSTCAGVFFRGSIWPD